MKHNDFIGGDYRYFKIRYDDLKWGVLKTTDPVTVRQILDAGGEGIGIDKYIEMRFGKDFYNKHKHRISKMKDELGSIIIGEDIGEEVPGYNKLTKELANNHI